MVEELGEVKGNFMSIKFKPEDTIFCISQEKNSENQKREICAYFK